MSIRATRLAGLYSIVAAALVLIVSPLLALAYFATKDGSEELETSTVSAWADHARPIASSLLTFASPDAVYATYLQAFALIFPSIVLCAWIVRPRRRDVEGRVERWGWRLALPGYALLTLGLVIAFCLELVALVAGHHSHNPVLNVIFLSMLLPGIVFSTLGSTVLGAGLIRGAYAPRATAWLLVIAMPFWIVVSTTLGHNSLGLGPLFLAWAATGVRLRRTAPATAAGPELPTVAAEPSALL